MAIQKIEVEVEGMSALIMHKFPLVPIEALEKRPPQEQAELAAYRHPDTGELYVPGENIQRALVSGATYSKGKGRASLQRTVAACLIVSPERVSLNKKEFEVDSRPVVVPATRGRVLRHRPRIENWRLRFFLEFEDTLLTSKQVREVVDNTGKLVGLLEYRPEKKGPFGRFMVTEWKNGSKN